MNYQKIVDLRLFQNKITNLINEGYSMVMITDYEYDWHVFPKEVDIVAAKKTTYKVNGLFGNMKCYTYDDDLGLSVKKLSNYIDIYGGDINNIGIDALINTINNNQKVLKK